MCEICGGREPCRCDDLAERSQKVPLFKLDCMEVVCDHSNTDYQPMELDTNVSESVWCLDCGEELDIPVPDYDYELKLRKESLL
jgi:hypothetical protein